MRRSAITTVLMSLCTLAFASGAWAQYTYNPNNADEQGSGTRYFGSVKDERGQALKGAAIVVKQAYVFTSDEAGRYVGHAPADPSPKAILIGCAKRGYTLVRINKRAGSTKQKLWVQADCILRKAL
jgi:hypothetical protein